MRWGQHYLLTENAMPAGLPHERGSQQGIPQAEEQDGVHSLL